MTGRQGGVLDDRYHAHVLRTPSEVRRARAYLLQNARRHYGIVGADPYTSTTAVIEPDTFLMRRLCWSWVWRGLGRPGRDVPVPWKVAAARP